MIENTNTKQFYPGPILNNTLEITRFLFNDPTQVKVKYSKLNTAGILEDIILTYGTQYEVTKVLPSDINAAEAALTASTGTVTIKNITVVEGEKLTVYRETPLIQDTKYPRTGAFPAASHEGALDYVTMQNQEQQEQIDRSLKIPNSVETFDAQMPTPLPARALKINADGTGFEMSEFDPDTALVLTEQYRTEAQAAAEVAVASKNTSIEKANIATEKAAVATTQANKVEDIYTEAVPALNKIIADGQSGLSETIVEGQQSLANASDALRQNQITNCLLEVPQKIKIEVIDGVLILKAGSNLTFPNIGNINRFTERTITVDATTVGSITMGEHLIFDAGGAGGESLRYCPITKVFSNTTEPTTPTESDTWYDLTNNVIRVYQGGAWIGARSLPIAKITVTENGISVDQVFNGFGYIGSTIWVDKGVRGLIPNGRNKDGTLNNIEFITQNILLRTNTEKGPFYCVLVDNGTRISIADGHNWTYDETTNYISNNGTLRQNIGFYGTITLNTSGVVLNFSPKLTFRAVDYNNCCMSLE